MKKGKLLVFLKFVTYLLALIINFYILYYMYQFFYNQDNSSITLIFSSTISTLFVLYIVYKKENSSFKLSWVLFSCFLPVAAIFIYLLSSKKLFTKKDFKNRDRITTEMKDTLKQNCSVTESIIDKDALSQVNLINNLSPFPVYKNSSVKYLKIGEEMHETMLNEMKLATKFIYLEYFIISKSSMLDEILDILFLKSSEGVEVKILFDSLGSGSTVPKDFVKTCEKNGIKCSPFNPFKFSLYNFVNYRDHRKMTIIDGNVCISGGINISDEYVNRVTRFGHWKDTAVLIKGEAVNTFTIMFANMWEYVYKERINISDKMCTEYCDDGSYVMPYGDGPDNKENPATNLYLKIINSAKNYLYIATPYLIIDEETTSALVLSAKSGVDIRIITPGIPDKKFINLVTKSNYDDLIKSGVKIYEYTPGFVHAKSIIYDDKTYIVGSINFDFRSLFWNFECATWVHNSQSIYEVKDDFVNMFEESKMLDANEIIGTSFFKQVIHSILKALSPLL